MKITYALLKRLGACEHQRERFRELFHKGLVFGVDGVVITDALCVSVAGEFDWDWAARNLLPAALRAEYEAKAEPLWAEYDAKRAPLWAEYGVKRAALFGELASQGIEP